MYAICGNLLVYFLYNYMSNVILYIIININMEKLHRSRGFYSSHLTPPPFNRHCWRYIIRYPCTM